jgi:hypothetical protein
VWHDTRSFVLQLLWADGVRRDRTRAQEPTSVLQKMAEIMEYSELLDKAAECEARCSRGSSRAPPPPLCGPPR